MCGIVACHARRPALGYLLPALGRLEYRGYDSAGVAVNTDQGDVVRLRSVGRLASLARRVAGHEDSFLGSVGIGHTRWATHGIVSEGNAHPQIDCAGDVHVVHNGIIENADELRAELSLRGHRFASEVDSETIAHLIEDELVSGIELRDAVRKAVARLIGSWALAVLRPGEQSIVVTAYRSPLVVTHNDAGSFAASDVTALVEWAEQVQVLDDGDLAELSANGIRWRRSDGTDSAPPQLRTGFSSIDVAQGDSPDYMAKEIAEQPQTTTAILARFTDGIADSRVWRDLDLPALERVRFVACGTSLNAAAVLARLLARWGIPATLGPASELDGVVHEPGTLSVALSQSGETADVLRAVEVHRRVSPLLVVTNAAYSTLGRAADAVVDLGVGPEIGVAATKTFTAQVVAGTAVLLSGLVAARRLHTSDAEELAERLRRVPAQIAVAQLHARVQAIDIARRLSDAPGFLFVARGAALPYAAEGALKLKEITYRWAECQAAGELKHGPMALIEPGTPVVVIDDGHPKLAGNVAEMSARRARAISVGGAGSTLPYRTDPPPEVPWGPVAAVVAVQHLAREIAVQLRRDVDKPRNLAKSVTVE
jgi:glucosamine--fructose-6-phosphate aminotransferase (isomerizing)